MKKYIVLVITVICVSQICLAQEDNYLWLEEIDGEIALQSVAQPNKATVAAMSAANNEQDTYNKNIQGPKYT